MADKDTQDQNSESEGGATAPIKEAKEAAQTVTSEMKKVAREAAIVVLTPVVKKAATSLTKQLAVKGPEFYQQYVEPKIDEAGGIGNLAKQATGEKGLKGMAVGKAAESVIGKFTGGGGSDANADGTGRGRRLPIQEAIDVGVPIDVAYNEWTQFENFPEFMHRVERIEQIDDTHVMWHENIWGRRRSWKAEITDQTPNERIAWRSEDGVDNVGVVTFHDLGDRLTRILVNLDFQPKGVLEKTASGFRISRRALRSDLMRFKAYVEMQDEEDGAWRGTVEDGEVVDYDEDYDPDEARAARGQGGRSDDQSDEYEDEADEEYEDEPEGQSDEYEDEADEDEADEDEADEDEYEDERGEDEGDEYEDEEEDEGDEDEYEDEEEEPAPTPRSRRSPTRSRRPAKKSSGTTRSTSTARKSSSSGTAKKTSSPARKSTSTARKRTSTAKKSSSAAKKSSTAKKSSSSPRRASTRTTKKSTGPARKTTTKKAPAKKSTTATKKSASSRSGTRRSSR